jgi:biopolymer transport protein ExbB
MQAAIAALAAAALCAPAAGQDPKGAPPAADGSMPRAAQGIPDNVIDLIIAGGKLNIAFMIVIGTFSLWSFAILFERLVMTRRSRMAPRPLVSGLEELVTRVEGSPQPFKLLCEKYPSPLANIVSDGVGRAGRPWPEVEKALEDGVARENGVLRQKIAGLGVSAAVATLLGLWGTVIGMVQAFQQASQVGTGKAESLAQGIYLALETTVAGLGVAIPALLMQGFLRGRNYKVASNWDAVVRALMPCFLRMERWEQRKREAEGASAVSGIMDRPPLAGTASSPSTPAVAALSESAVNAEAVVGPGDDDDDDEEEEQTDRDMLGRKSTQESQEIELEPEKKPKIPSRPGGTGGVRGR